MHRTYEYDSNLLRPFNQDTHKVIKKIEVRYKHNLENLQEAPVVLLKEYEKYSKGGKPELLEEKKVSRDLFKGYEKPKLTLSEVGLYFLKRSHMNKKGKGFEESDPVDFVVENF